MTTDTTTDTAVEGVAVRVPARGRGCGRYCFRCSRCCRGVSATVMILPLDREKRTEDLVGITLLPWLLGYGVARLVRAARARRGGGAAVE
ncbi:hypothetical protein [Streptomyces sp. NPDC088757]|uniref:hypothetical protein n=1 Tax=Streptomyces sp. NPDC088757 TaxID=3365889 RepID=UPI0037F272CD